MKSNGDTEFYEFEMGDTKTPNDSSTTHLGIKRATTISKTAEEKVQFNISKARETFTVYSQLVLHGQNDLDPQTSLHITRIYGPGVSFQRWKLTPFPLNIDLGHFSTLNTDPGVTGVNI